jgi:hypothetical protein
MSPTNEYSPRDHNKCTEVAQGAVGPITPRRRRLRKRSATPPVPNASAQDHRLPFNFKNGFGDRAPKLHEMHENQSLRRLSPTYEELFIHTSINISRSVTVYCSTACFVFSVTWKRMISVRLHSQRRFTPIKVMLNFTQTPSRASEQ